MADKAEYQKILDQYRAEDNGPGRIFAQYATPDISGAKPLERPLFADDNPVTNRATLFPLADYADQTTRLAWPGIIHDAYQGMRDAATIDPKDNSPESIDKLWKGALGVAGLATTGGMLAPRPANSLGMFGGRLAKTADQAALAEAERMSAAGASREDIWHKTGYFQGADKQWRFELDDSASKWSPLASRADEKYDLERSLRQRYGGSLADITKNHAADPDVVHYNELYQDKLNRMMGAMAQRPTDNLQDFLTHGKLYDAYPSIAGIKTAEGAVADGARGHFNTQTGSLHVHKDIPLTEKREVALHEGQHAIQSQEGFATGANPDRFTSEALKQEAFEKHSRDIQALMEQDPQAAETFRAVNRFNARIPKGKELTNAEFDEITRLEAELLKSPIGKQLSDMDWTRASVQSYPDDYWRSIALDKYRAHAGEVEARTVQKRMDLTPEERRARPPWLDYDVPEKDQIVRFGNTSPQMSAQDILKKEYGSTTSTAPGEANAITLPSAPDWAKWKANVGKPEFTAEDNYVHLPVLNADGKSVGNIGFRDKPDAVYIDGVSGGRRNGGKGETTKAVKAVIDYAQSTGRPVIATATGGARPYWDIMGFRTEGHNSILDAAQISKLRSGDLNSTTWGHEKGYGNAFEDMYGPGASELAQSNGERISGKAGREGSLNQPNLSAQEILKREYGDTPESLRGYHGTNQGFDKAELRANPRGESGSREGPLGFWGTDNPEAAGNFADWAARGGDGARIMPLDFDFKNPLVVDNYNKVRDIIDQHTVFNRPDYEVGGRQIRMTQDKVDHAAARQALIDQGHDGVVVRKTLTDSPDGVTPIDQYIAIKPGTVRNALTGDIVYSNPKEAAAVPLAMDAASRMARAKEMGFDTGLTLYHGTKNPVEEFNLRKAGQSDPGLVGKAVYLTPSGEQAGQFAMSHHYGKGDNPNVMPLLARMRNPAIVVDGRLPDGRMLTEAHPNGIQKHTAAALSRDLKKAGYDGVVFQTSDGEITQAAVFDPSNVRSTNATFDPAKSKSTNLLSANPAQAIAAPLAAKDREKN